MSIFIIRHGESVQNAARIFQHPEAPLSERGQAQAQQVAKRLAEAGIGKLICSHYARALMTAQAIAGTTNLKPEIHEILHERNYGDLRGKSHDAVDVDPHSPHFNPPGGESWDEFHQRVDDAWQLITEIDAACDGHLAVVTHGLVCSALLDRHLTVTDTVRAPSHWPNTAVTIASSTHPHELELVGCGAHLNTDESRDAGQLATGI